MAFVYRQPKILIMIHEYRNASASRLFILRVWIKRAEYSSHALEFVFKQSVNKNLLIEHRNGI